ncbi:MAG TPA: translocation/assembly module TamB domain-containing protein, partial [Bryobacteraceae bacterium]|nr:translocation/assembly module TamB domain-containing protein [Bryobacteraceae bacterium]
KLEVTTAGAGLKGGAPVVALRNNGPVTMVKNQTGIHIQQARFAGPITAVNVTGDVTLKPAAALNLNVAANADLALLSQIERDVSSSGDVSLSASVKGPPASPLVDGRVQLSNAAFQKTEWPSGVSNANGVILLTGNSARIQSLNAESGGGKISVTGGVTRSGSRFTFNLQTRANNVMVLTQAGVSAVANANVKLTGTNESSLLSGNVTVLSVGFQTHTDIGSILTQTAAPMVTPSAPKGFMAGMKLDIAIRMAVGATFRSSYTENLEAQAGLTLRGTAANAGMLGRVTITQGTLVFFGTKYTINEGSVTFFNPSKIEPVLNVNLGTTVQGVNVILTVTGPVQNMNFSYHSDPPLQFSEIIGLLAAGKTPTSDPVLLANQPQTPSQSFTQMGESALVSTVIANPVAGQLQRVFGVTSLKISPSFVSGSELPQARLTLQQRISQDITFTYVTDLNTADPQIVRVEWAISPQWSAVATRDVNGLVGVDFFYKHSFR